MKILKTHKAIAKYTGLEVERIKAINILEELGIIRTYKKRNWYELEDIITEIIKSK